MDMARRARALLACSDLPARDPTLRLRPSQRLRLQRECLYQGLLTTSLARNTQLLLLAVQAALHNGTARAMITDTTFRLGYLASSFASHVLVSAALPDSPYHFAWHAGLQLTSAPAPRGRRRSESDVVDLAAVACDCRASRETLREVKEDAQQSKLDFLDQLGRRGRHIAAQHVDDDDDVDFDYESDEDYDVGDDTAGYDDLVDF